MQTGVLIKLFLDLGYPKDGVRFAPGETYLRMKVLWSYRKEVDRPRVCNFTLGEIHYLNFIRILFVFLPKNLFNDVINHSQFKIERPFS